MTETLRRYPGAQPFRDDEISRKSFFGRDSASAALTDQILANRLVVVYARSGLGKTSLLNAGVAPRLREAGSLPLFARVNDVKRGAVTSILEDIRAEAERQGVEYIAGDTRSLWSFFKTAEFWRGDLLLTPVLIVDQFEELFTLQPFEERDKFLSELGYLLRGTPPPSLSLDNARFDPSPPVIHVVLSLREDFLGLLEEGSDQIPEILDHRYRVSPLTPEMASKAITGPAALEYAGITTRAFSLEPECIEAILRYLTHSTGEPTDRRGLQVEPFHLQLICQHLESVAAFKQKLAPGEVVLSFADIGGDHALADTLKSFYSRSIAALPHRYRRAARKMCERHLISPEGRRLSVEERQLTSELKLPHDVLSQLADRRLLRTDRRSDNTYYELGHDALVAPVLASGQTQSILLYGAAIFAGSISILLALFLTFVLIAAYYGEPDKSASLVIGLVFCLAFAIFFGFLGRASLRAGIRRRSRYGIRSTAALPHRPPFWKRLLGWSMLLAAPALLLFWGLYGVIGLIQYSYVAVRHGKVAESLVWMVGGVHEAWLLMHDHPFLEMFWWVLIHGTTVLFGWWLFWQGDRLLWHEGFSFRSHSSPPASIAEPTSLTAALLRTGTGIIALAAAALGIFTLRTCSSSWHGAIPYWLNWPMMSYRLSDACQLIYQHDWNFDAFNFVLFFISAFALALVLLIGGIFEIRAALRFRRITLNESPARQSLILAGASCLLVFIFAIVGLFWHPPATLESTIAARTKLGGALALFHPYQRHAGWAAGSNATILYTNDDGRTWKTQVNGTGWLNSIRSISQSQGCAVGNGGTIWMTTDGGAHWDTEKSGTHLSLRAITFFDPNHGWVAGGDSGSGGVILHTEDGGVTWNSQPLPVPKAIFAMAFATPKDGWAVGEDGIILHTDDTGATWTLQTSPSHNSLNDIAFPTAQSGWAVGEDGIILHTEDAGRTWNPQSSGTIRALYGVSFPTAQSGWIFGQLGTILHTDNGGRTWLPQPSPTRVDISEASFSDARFGWAVGNAGVILHAEDGRTWMVENSGIRNDLRSVTFIKPYGFLGIDLKKNTPFTQGAVIESLLKDGPAAKAGLRPNDLVVAVDDNTIVSSDDLVDRIYLSKPGSTVTLTYIRSGRPSTTTVVLGDGSKLSP